MLLISLLFALLLEYYFPPKSGFLDDPMKNFFSWFKTKLDVGEEKTAFFAWFILVFLSAFICWFFWEMLIIIHPVFGLLFLIGLLYLTLGFKQFIQRYSDIQKSLNSSETDKARIALLNWAKLTNIDPVILEVSKNGDSSQISREAIKLLVISLHRNLFALIFWFLVLPGPFGLIMYKMAVFSKQFWANSFDSEELISQKDKDSFHPSTNNNMIDYFKKVANRGFFWIDWISCRITAFIFAIVGNFEDAVAMLRASSSIAPISGVDSERIILAASEGAMTLKLTIPTAVSGIQQLNEFENSSFQVELREPEENSMNIALGLSWRSLILWLIILLLITFGYFYNLLI
jgi:cobalamin biosynthesis protein CobD/CbiB